MQYQASLKGFVLAVPSRVNLGAQPKIRLLTKFSIMPSCKFSWLTSCHEQHWAPGVHEGFVKLSISTRILSSHAVSQRNWTLLASRIASSEKGMCFHSFLVASRASTRIINNTPLYLRLPRTELRKSLVKYKHVKRIVIIRTAQGLFFY
jgi:hypothetical protein